MVTMQIVYFLVHITIREVLIERKLIQSRLLLIITIAFPFFLSTYCLKIEPTSFHFQYAGDPIDCVHNLAGMPDKYMDTFCWVEGTWTHRPNDGTLMGKGGEIEHLKCDQDANGNVVERGTDKPCWHHLYYQWVGLMLIFQAGCFYFPKYVSIP